MTAARWKETRDFLVAGGLLKPKTDWHKRLHRPLRRRTSTSEHDRRACRAAPPEAVGAEPQPLPVVELLSADKVFANGTRGLAPISLTLRAGRVPVADRPVGLRQEHVAEADRQPASNRATAASCGGAAASTRSAGAGRRLAFVFQDATLMPWARSTPTCACRSTSPACRKAESAPRVAAALRAGRPRHLARHLPAPALGRHAMRVSIARALVTDPDLLLMDEPFGALDEFTRNRLDADLARPVVASAGSPRVFVTHSIYEAVFLSTRIVVMAAQPRPHLPRDRHRRAPAARRRIPRQPALRRPLPRTVDAARRGLAARAATGDPQDRRMTPLMQLRGFAPLARAAARRRSSSLGVWEWRLPAFAVPEFPVPDAERHRARLPVDDWPDAAPRALHHAARSRSRPSSARSSRHPGRLRVRAEPGDRA